MEITRKNVAKIGIIGFVIVSIVVSPLMLKYMLNSRQSPKQQLDELAERTNKVTANLMKNNKYSTEIRESRCLNQGQDDFFAFGRDTIHCMYDVDIHTSLSEKDLRNLVENSGWKRKLYQDGSSSDYFKKGTSICSISDNQNYENFKGVKAFEGGLLHINCQSFTEHYNSPLKKPSEP